MDGLNGGTFQLLLLLLLLDYLDLFIYYYYALFAALVTGVASSCFILQTRFFFSSLSEMACL
jgi:hypothetical protein